MKNNSMKNENKCQAKRFQLEYPFLIYLEKRRLNLCATKYYSLWPQSCSAYPLPASSIRRSSSYQVKRFQLEHPIQIYSEKMKGIYNNCHFFSHSIFSTFHSSILLLSILYILLPAYSFPCF